MAWRSMTVNTNTNVGIGAVLACLLSWMGMPAQASAQVMENYTNMPITINKTVEPNVLFLVDLGSATLEAAYTTTTRTGYYYPRSYDAAANTYVSGTGKAYYAANFTADNVTLTVPTSGSDKDKCVVTTTMGGGGRAMSLSSSTPILQRAIAKGSKLTPAECASATSGGGGAIDEYYIEPETDDTYHLTDQFNTTIKYYGLFDPERCYYYNAGEFRIGTDSSARKGTGNYSDKCPSTKWDGNFLNWLAMRKQEIIQKVLVGGSGHTTPAQANLDGTANSIAGEPDTGSEGGTGVCGIGGSGTVTACWGYIKYVPLATLDGRVPTTGTTALPVPVVVVAGGAAALKSGIFFGVRDGKIYVNDNAGVNPFDNATANRYVIKIDLTSEPDIPTKTSTKVGPDLYDGTSCDPDDPDMNFAGHTVCYQREQSLGIFQKMNLGNIHIGVMMVNAQTGKGGSVFFGFDKPYNSSVVATLRNKKVEAKAPLAESLYEALCLFRKSQGPCYSNTGSAASWGTNYTNATGATGDPFYYAEYAKMVTCCKNYVIMISSGIGIADGNNPDLATPFPTGSTINPSYSANIGVKASTSSGDAASAAAGDRLDDVAYYGRTTDLRSDVGGDQFVTFFGVNAMGRKTGATLMASAAKYGGFEDKNKDGSTDFTPTSGQVCVYPADSKLNPGTGGPFYSDPDWDSAGPDRDGDGKDDDPDCLPDTFYDANDGESLTGAIQAAINDIMKKSSSGTSISVLASSSTGEGSIYQAYFYPETTQDDRTVKWTGYLQGLFIDSYGNLREDKGPGGNPDGRLIYTDDTIIKTAIDPDSGDVFIQRFEDSDGDGKADSTTPSEIVPLRATQGIWEAGRKLAVRDLSAKPRNLFAWVDKNNDGVVNSNEQVAFTTANASVFAKYLRASTTGTYTATNIINFLQGNQVSGMRDRQLTVDGALRVWRLGDIVNSSPTIVGPPRERFDILYGDSGYRQFLQRWATRRQTAFVGANDGMLHAFNVGYYHRGDDPSTTGEIEHGWYTTAPTDNSSGPELGEELWGFIPHYVLPQLIWYTQNDYTHISYVDLKPKVTDVRIFTPEAACGSTATPTPTATGCIHPDGWGTILIIGLRFGGSCGQCIPVSGTNNGAPPLSVTADFNGTGTTSTRFFYSGYVVLDITDPEATPTVLTAYSSPSLGLTTAYPTVVRVSPSGDGKNDHTNAKWMMVLGSGVHGYDGRTAANPSLVSVTLVPQGTAPTVRAMSAGGIWGHMADGITFDKDLDFRSDVVYVGQTLSGDPSTGSSNGTGLGYWSGKFLRLTMGTCTSSCSASTWGDSGSNGPTEIVAEVPIGGVNVPLGPLMASSSVTLDSGGNVWVFFGTGRFMSNADKTDQHAQYLVGVKDSVIKGSCVQTSATDCQDQDLLDVTNAAICISCTSGTQVQGMGATTTFSGLVDQIQGNASAGIPAKDGWVIQLEPNSGSPDLGAERSVVNPTLIGGAVFFPTFTPDSDPCVALGNSKVYGLYYLTGTGHTDPIMGVDADGMAKKSINIGQGLASAVAIQITGDPSGMSGIVQTTDASLHPFKSKPPAVLWSQYIGWIAQRV